MRNIYVCAIISGINEGITRINLLNNFKFEIISDKDNDFIKFYTNLNYEIFDRYSWISKTFNNSSKYICITKKLTSNEEDDYKINDDINKDLINQINAIRLLTGESVYVHSIYKRFEDKKDIYYTYDILGYKKTFLHPNMLSDEIVNYTNSKLKKFSNISDAKLLKLAQKYYFLSFDELDDNNSIVFLIIGLEILFSPADNVELNNRVARNCAVFLGNNLQESKKIFSDIKNFYTYRSKIVHTGDLNVKGKNWVDYFNATKKLQHILRYAIINYYEKIYLKNIHHTDFINKLNESGMKDNPYNCEFKYTHSKNIGE